MLVSGALGTLLLQGEQPSVPALKAVRDIAAGAAVSSADFETVWLPDRLAGDWLTASSLGAGSTASRPLREGDLAYLRDITGLRDGRPVIALALPAASLPAGLHVGQSVDLWEVSMAEPRLIAGRATLRAITEDSASRLQTLSVAVESAALAKVIRAVAGDGLAVVAVAG